MHGDDQAARPTFDLEPRGPELSRHTIGTLAQGGGNLAGAIVDGSVRTWLTGGNGQLTLVVWPGTSEPVSTLLRSSTTHGDVVARGRQFVTVAGGFLKSGDPRSLGHELVFSAWQVSEAYDRAR
jgi:hypothetical protein